MYKPKIRKRKKGNEPIKTLQSSKVPKLSERRLYRCLESIHGRTIHFTYKKKLIIFK